jgi:protein-disulfide isomerase
MAYKANKTRRTRQKQKKMNWLVVGSVALVGTVALFGLLYLALREPEALSLADYCTQNPERCVTQGEAAAPVTLVEVSDFACHNCRDFYEQTAPLIEEQYVETEQVRWVALPYALRAETVPAANAAMCAADQEAYFPFAEALFAQFEEPDILTREGFLTTAASLSLDMGEFTTCVDEEKHVDVVQQNMTAARLAGVGGTPTFFINGGELRGAQPFDAFQQRIEAWLSS